jgi:hypothetical protein
MKNEKKKFYMLHYTQAAISVQLLRCYTSLAAQIIKCEPKRQIIFPYALHLSETNCALPSFIPTSQLDTGL